MKKILLVVAFASAIVSCKKVQAGGNIGVLRLEEGTTRYSDDVMTDGATAKTDGMHYKKEMPAMDSGKVTTHQEMEGKKDSTVKSEATHTATTPEKK
jgi:hypothetical protein